MGLEKLLRGLYGTAPQIDLDRKLARARVPQPTKLDFFALGDGIVRSNMGVGGIRIHVSATVAGGKVTVLPTGQSFPLAGSPPPEPGPRRRWFRVKDWQDRSRTALEAVP